MKNQFTKTLIKIGTKLLPIVFKIVQKISDVFNENKEAIKKLIDAGYRKLKDIIEKAVPVFERMRDAFKEIFDTIFPSMEDFKEFVEIFLLLAGAVVGATVAIGFLTNPLTIIIGAIALLALAIKKFKDKFPEAFEKIKDTLGKVAFIFSKSL